MLFTWALHLKCFRPIRHVERRFYVDRMCSIGLLVVKTREAFRHHYSDKNLISCSHNLVIENAYGMSIMADRPGTMWETFATESFPLSSGFT